MTTQNENNKEAITELEVLQPSALHALEESSINQQVATAHRFPRSMAQFQKRALEMISADVETAESCIYRRPVGKENVNGKWVEKYASGKSVRFAEIAAAAYGNFRAGYRIIEQTDRQVRAQGIAHDLESNNYISTECTESTVKADGTPYSERMRLVVAKSAESKAYRDAVFRVIPAALCKRLEDEARKIAIGDANTLSERRDKVRGWLKQIDVDDARVFAALNIQGWADVSLTHLETLTGLKTALKDGDLAVADAFPLIMKKGEIGKTEGAATGAVTEKQAETTTTFDKPYEEIVRRTNLDGITIAQVFGYCCTPGVRFNEKPKVDSLDQMPNDKLNMLLKSWSSILPNIRKIEVK